MIESKGHVNPGDPEVRFRRFTIGLEDLVRHVWVVRWSIPADETRPQRVLAYPAGNIVLMPGHCRRYGPDPSVDVRELSGEGWAVGLLLRPAALPLLTSTPPDRLVASSETLAAPPGALDLDDEPALTESLATWLADTADRIDSSGRLLNDVCAEAENDASLTRVDQLAERFGLSTRTLERLVARGLGVSPKWLLDCRRLQEAATRLFAEPDIDLAGLAGELGYADQAHFTRHYRRVLGETPDATRRAGRAARRSH